MDSVENEAIVNEEVNNVESKTSNDAAEEEEDNSRPSNRGGGGNNGASPGKIFIGGLARETTSAQFTKHFGEYGEITDSVIMKDRNTGQPRGFGFITYADASVVDQVIQETHIINGKQVEIKRTIPKGSSGTNEVKTKKIFVGGIPTTLTEEEFKELFSKFGEVKEHQIMRDPVSDRSRGFGFITFDTDKSVDDLLSKGNKIEMAGVQVEVRKAEPKKPNPPMRASKSRGSSRPSYAAGFGDAYGGGYGGGAGGGGYGAGGPYRSGGAYGGRANAYGGYGGSEYGGYGGYGGGGGGMGAYRGGDPPLGGYSGRYGGGGGYSRGYDMGGSGYGGEPYGGPISGGGAVGGGGYGVPGYDSSMGGAGGYGASNAGSFYGSSRGGYGGGGAPGSYGGGPASGRYHPYGR